MADEFESKTYSVTWNALQELTQSYYREELLGFIQGRPTPWMVAHMKRAAKDPERRYRFRSRRGQRQDFGLAANALLRRAREHGDVPDAIRNCAMRAVIESAYQAGYDQGADDNY